MCAGPLTFVAWLVFLFFIIFYIFHFKVGQVHHPLNMPLSVSGFVISVSAIQHSTKICTNVSVCGNNRCAYFNVSQLLLDNCIIHGTWLDDI